MAGQGKNKVGPKLSLEKNLVCAIILLTYGAEIIIDIFVQKLQNWLFGYRNEKKEKWFKILLDANFDNEKSLLPFQKAWSTKTFHI